MNATLVSPASKIEFYPRWEFGGNDPPARSSTLPPRHRGAHAHRTRLPASTACCVQINERVHARRRWAKNLELRVHRVIGLACRDGPQPLPARGPDPRFQRHQVTRLGRVPSSVPDARGELVVDSRCTTPGSVSSPKAELRLQRVLRRSRRACASAGAGSRDVHSVDSIAPCNCV